MVRTMRIMAVGGFIMTFKEIERLLLNDGWYLKATKGSHHQYIHDSKRGKITIPKHPETSI